MSLESVKTELEKDLAKVNTIEELNELKNKYLSKKGLISQLSSDVEDSDNTIDNGTNAVTNNQSEIVF